jgi:hypothetical protein
MRRLASPARREKPPVAEDAIPELAWITIPFGLTLVGLAMLDVFLTVLHVQVESPISNHLERRVWQLLVQISRTLPPHARDELLGWGAPLMIGGIVVFWSILYVVGFALLYVPYVHSPSVFFITGVQPQFSFEDALYFSALTFFTLGYGEIVPVHPILRLLAVLQGALGLTTLSLSVTYLLSVYPLIARKIGLAESLNLETGGRSDGVVVAERYIRGGRYEALGQRLVEINDELMKLGQSHGLYPVLYYVRPREVHHSFVRVLAIVQGIVATLRYGLDPNEYHDVVTDPRLLILEEGLLLTLHTLAASSHLAPAGARREDLDLARRDHLTLIESLRQRGLVAVTSEDRDALVGHTRFRAATEHYIRAYAANSGYPVEAVHAQYSRWDRDSALVGHAETDGQSRAQPEPVAAVDGALSDPEARPITVTSDASSPT